jgi:hypothetical protein
MARKRKAMQAARLHALGASGPEGKSERGVVSPQIGGIDMDPGRLGRVQPRVTKPSRTSTDSLRNRLGRGDLL